MPKTNARGHRWNPVSGREFHNLTFIDAVKEIQHAHAL